MRLFCWLCLLALLATPTAPTPPAPPAPLSDYTSFVRVVLNRPVPPPPPVTESRYIVKTAPATMQSYGCKLAQSMQPNQEGYSLLLFGRPAYDTTTQQYGTRLLDDSRTFTAISTIEQAAEYWADGFWNCTPVQNSPKITLLVGTSNDGEKDCNAMSNLKHSCIVIISVLSLLFLTSCGQPDSHYGQFTQPSAHISTVSAPDSPQTNLRSNPQPSEQPTPERYISTIDQTIIAENPWKDPHRTRPSITPTATRTPLPPGIPSPTPSPTIAERVFIDNGASGVLIHQPQFIGGYRPSNEWLIERGTLRYVVYAGYTYDRVEGGGPRQGMILKYITDTSGDQERHIYEHDDYLPIEEGTPRIVTAYVSDTSMQLIITTASGTFYRYDVLEETLELITPAELTATPLLTNPTQPEATTTPWPSSVPTPLQGAAGGWMIEHPWIHPHYTLTNAWRMSSDQDPTTFYAGYEYEQNRPSAPKRAVLIVGSSIDQDTAGTPRFTSVYHLPRGTGAARISNVTSDGTHYQLTIQTDAGRTFLFDGGIDGPKELQP